MPRATLEFDLPQEQAEYEITVKAGDMYSLLCAITEELRRATKYPDESVGLDPGTMSSVREQFWRLAEEFEIHTIL